MSKTSERIWIATAPSGVWSSGPSVIYGEGENGLGSALHQYREMGWEVAGPYVLEPKPPPTISGRTQAEVNAQQRCAGCYPQVTETGPCICADEMAQRIEEPPDAPPLSDAERDRLRWEAEEYEDWPNNGSEDRWEGEGGAIPSDPD